MDLEYKYKTADIINTEQKYIFSPSIFESKNNTIESYEDTYNLDLRYFNSIPILQESIQQHQNINQSINIIQNDVKYNIIENDGKNPIDFLKRKRKVLEKKISHDKHCHDNMMRKIKTNIMDYLLNKLNDSLIDKEYKFHRIDKYLNECIKKDYNINLLKRTVFDIFYNSKTSKKYKSTVDDYFNRYLIQKILQEKKEINTINLLNKQFIDIINEIRKEEQNMNYFINKIKKKENKLKGANKEEYICSLKNLLIGYENWFIDKKGRNRMKKDKLEKD